MANTVVEKGLAHSGGRKVVKIYETSAANTALTVSTPTDRTRVLRLLSVYVKYSTNVTKNVTITYNAEQGAAYDTLHQTIALATADEGVFVPDEAVYIFPGDTYDVTAEAGGSGVTCAITVFCLEF